MLCYTVYRVSDGITSLLTLTIGHDTQDVKVNLTSEINTHDIHILWELNK